MSIPTDPILYGQIKEYLWQRYPVNSAYRSGMLVRRYKEAFEAKHNHDGAYLSARRPDSGLTRWFAEEWRNQRGEVGYKYKSDIYRPTRRITARTPTTFSELTPGEINRARYEKASRGRVVRYHRGTN